MIFVQLSRGVRVEGKVRFNPIDLFGALRFPRSYRGSASSLDAGQPSGHVQQLPTFKAVLPVLLTAAVVNFVFRIPRGGVLPETEYI